MILTAEEYARVRSQAAAEYPAECCGVVMEKNGERLLLPCRNIQDELHAKDPQRHPRDSRTAYYIDPKDLIAMGRREAQGYRVLPSITRTSTRAPTSPRPTSTMH